MLFHIVIILIINELQIYNKCNYFVMGLFIIDVIMKLMFVSLLLSFDIYFTIIIFICLIF